MLQFLEKLRELRKDFRYQRKWDKTDPSVEANHLPPDKESFKEKALKFHNFYVTSFPFAIVKPVMHSIVDHFWEYIGDLGAMAAEALESQHKDFRFALSHLAYQGNIQRALDDATKSMFLTTSEILNETMATKPVVIHHCSNCGSSLHKTNKCCLNCSNCDSKQHKLKDCHFPCKR